MKLYFDTSIFLWGYGGEKEKDEDHQKCANGIADIMNKFEEGKLKIATSTITLAEIMPKRTGNPAYGKVISALGRMQVYPVEKRIANSAARLRDAFRHGGSSGGKLKTPDAIHIATAIFLEVKYICTTDKGLLKRDDVIREISGRNIKIVRPPVSGVDKLLL